MFIGFPEMRINIPPNEFIVGCQHSTRSSFLWNTMTLAKWSEGWVKAWMRTVQKVCFAHGVRESPQGSWSTADWERDSAKAERGLTSFVHFHASRRQKRQPNFHWFVQGNDIEQHARAHAHAACFHYMFALYVFIECCHIFLLRCIDVS